DFWHAVEFSRNGGFLRSAFRQALRALRSFVFSAYQINFGRFTGFIRSEFPLGEGFADPNGHFSVLTASAWRCRRH
ncbi:hypothetical protein ACIRBX_29240, partial [Kitasatospora sp. NPDC096147]|uniref:hypothetical protein n=1 Tax=Kitasatospora sp. NPDC096147 TaxID=3364093 RepID=UPI00382DB7FA